MTLLGFLYYALFYLFGIITGIILEYFDKKMVKSRNDAIKKAVSGTNLKVGYTEGYVKKP